ncbi:MAG: hypothetical protein JO337_09985 [Acidimicrobiales bacterium]|nr:hypothetical protein [Acidimicrobiales bacterium]
MSRDEMTTWRRFAPPALAAVILAAGAVAAFQVLPNHSARTARMSKLVPAASLAGYKAKPAQASTEDSTQSPFAGVKAAAKRDPKRTGTYAILWDGNTSGDTASIVLSLLPTPAEAKTVVAQAKTASLGQDSYTSASYKFDSSFDLPGVPGGSGALYAPATATVKQQLAVSEVAVGDVVAVVYLNQTGDLPAIRAADVALAQRQYQLLQRVTPGFTLSTTSWPPVATATWAAVTVVLALSVIGLPVLFRRSRLRRELARRETARKQVLTRGAKIARRQAAPRR